MKIEIKNRWNGSVIFCGEFGSLKLAVEKAVELKTNLRAANLRAANLRAADLSAANLSDADLRAADLRAADLSDADLSDADLSAANLRAADLSDANLRDADFSPIRDDFWAVLSSAPNEVAALRQALVHGKVDGSTYHGDCACLVGTIANARHCGTEALGLLKPDSNRPIERLFLNIKPGDTPKTNQVSKLAVEWLDTWVDGMKAAFGSK